MSLVLQYCVKKQIKLQLTFEVVSMKMATWGPVLTVQYSSKSLWTSQLRDKKMNIVIYSIWLK